MIGSREDHVEQGEASSIDEVRREGFDPRKHLRSLEIPDI